MRSVRLFDCLQYDGNSWQVVAQDGATLVLKNLTTARLRKVAIADLLGDDRTGYRTSTPPPSWKHWTPTPGGARSSYTGMSWRS